MAKICASLLHCNCFFDNKNISTEPKAAKVRSNGIWRQCCTGRSHV